HGREAQPDVSRPIEYGGGHTARLRHQRDASRQCRFRMMAQVHAQVRTLHAKGTRPQHQAIVQLAPAARVDHVLHGVVRLFRVRQHDDDAGPIPAQGVQYGGKMFRRHAYQRLIQAIAVGLAIERAGQFTLNGGVHLDDRDRISQQGRRGPCHRERPIGYDDPRAGREQGGAAVTQHDSLLYVPFGAYSDIPTASCQPCRHRRTDPALFAAMTTTPNAVRTRFAPSPTGFLHLAGPRTALFSWAYARHHAVTFVLRIEDTDLERSTPEAVQAILDGMEWLGLTPDEGPFYQMQRMDRYREVIQGMLRDGTAYHCYCTPEEVEAMREKARAAGLKPRYDGTWRPEPGKVLPTPPADRQP